MTTDRFQGDPKLTLNEEGSALTYVGGQPVMDGGIENAIFISLFTEPGWAGNYLLQDENQKIGSRFEAALRQPLTISALNDIRDAAEKALNWMVDSGLASRVTASVSNPSDNRVQVVIVVEYPGKDLDAFLALKNAQNWIIQKIDPANLRV
jgi:phage gp46-like protein